VTLPDKLTAAEFERLKAQEQRMLNSGSWVPQAENTWAAEMNAKAAEDAAPATMTSEQADAALAQQSVAAETSFGRSMGARPDYSSGPAVNPADSEPKTIEELRRKQQELYHDPSYEMPFDEWKDFTQWQRETEGEVSGFLRGLSGAPAMLGQLGAGIVQERAQQYMRAMGGDPIGAATAEVATFKEMGRKVGAGLTQLTDWAGGKINDMVASGRRVGQMQANIVQALRDSGKLTGDPVVDNTTIQQAMEEAKAQGMFEPTQQEAEEDEETGYQRYLRNQAYTREYMGVTQYSLGGNPITLPDVKKTATNPLTGQVEQPMESTATVAAMAASPENFIPVGVGALAKVRMLRRFASITGKGFKLGEEGAAALDGMIMRGADRLTSKIPLVGDLSLNKRMAALGGVGAAAAYLDTQIDSPVVDFVAKPLIVAGAFLPAVKGAGATLRKVGSASGATWQIIKEMDAGAVGSVRAEAAARMAASGKFNPRYAQYMRSGASGGVESTLRRVSQNADMPETLRRVARSADNIGITQLARGADDVVSSAAVAGLAATPFALAAPDSETAGAIFGGALMLGGTTGAAARVIGRRSARTDADIARMMVDVEMAGGDAASLGALSYSGLDMLSAMQGITSGKVDFIPLRAQEYRANADIRASGAETVAGLHIERAADGRAKVYVNMGHTAPIAGRVSVKPVQITRNGKTEEANVVRIKGEDGQSDFTVVPREYPLLVKSGDLVEANAHLARGLSPTKIMPHEIGHAILTSSILNGTLRDDLRNLVNQRYDTPGVQSRGREYVTRLVDKDILAGAHDQLPDKLTQQEFDDIASGKQTMADVLKGKPVSDAARQKMIEDRYNEMRERSIADGDNPDGLDVFRDEIVAETFSSLSNNMDFRSMRTGGPQVMESVLAAATRVFETLGMAFNPSTGKPLDNPSVIFRDNPLMQDPVMRKRMQEHLRNYEAWMLGMEQAGAREQRGTQISVDGSAESARRSTHTKLRANENGILENDLIYIDQNGTAQWKSQGVLDQQERGRSAQVGQLYDKNKIVAPNSAEFGLRRTGGGRTIISGPTLPAKFDVLRWFPKHVREMARMLEASRDRGASHIFDYNTIGTGEGGRYRVINRGDVQAILREGAFLGWEATKAGHLKAVIMDLNAFRAAAMKAINKGELGIFNNDMAQVHADLLVYLSNHKAGLPGEATIGQQKRDMLNGLIGTGTAVQRDINPLYTDLNPRGSVRTFRIDRVNDITPTGRDGYHFDYDKIKNNRMPQQIPREAQGMPDAVEGMTTDQLLRQYEENQGYLGLSTLGMREGRPVRGGAAQARELLRRNEAINAELERRGVRQEDPQLQRALQRRGQAMPDVSPQDAFEYAKRRHGTTRSIYEAGYVLPDGTMLDFSGKSDAGGYERKPDGNFGPQSGQRDYLRDTRNSDHREIRFSESQEFGGNEAMTEFMRKGAVRVDANSGLISIHGRQRLTSAQKGVIKDIVRSQDGAWLDLEDDAGNRTSLELKSGKWAPVEGLLNQWADGKTPRPRAQFMPDAVHGDNRPLPQQVPDRGFYIIGTKPATDGRVLEYHLDPATTVRPRVADIESIRGEQVAMLEADRHNTRGDNMGGPLHPFLISNQTVARLPDGRGFKAVWANMNSAFVTRAKNIVKNTTAGHALIQIMKENAHRSNRKFVMDVTSEIDARRPNMTADQSDFLHVVLELGAINPQGQINRAYSRVERTSKAVLQKEATMSELAAAQRDYDAVFKKYQPMVKFLDRLSPLKSHATRKRMKEFDGEFASLVSKHRSEPWYSGMAAKYRNTKFVDEAARFSFKQRGAAMDRITGIPFAPDVKAMLKGSMDFVNGQNLDVVGVVQLSKDVDTFAVYFGKNANEEAKMSANERMLRDQFLASGTFKPHPSYDWVMLGPEKADSFILDAPADPLKLFPDYAKNHPNPKVKKGSKETVVGTMKKSKIPLVIK
jgi:hypothetical protein